MHSSSAKAFNLKSAKSYDDAELLDRSHKAIIVSPSQIQTTKPLLSPLARAIIVSPSQSHYCLP